MREACRVVELRLPQSLLPTAGASRAMPVMTDCDFLFDVLADGQEHSLNEILRRSFAVRACGLTVHSRVSDLRARGHRIEHRTVGKRGDGSLYRLVITPVQLSLVEAA